MPKRLVMCCDGTWNTAGQKCPTNVMRFKEAVATEDADGVRQVAYYHEGVGTTRWERFRGGAFGFGLSRIVREAYRIVLDDYEPGDELFLIGFSRGAFTARSLAGLIRKAGILRRDEAHRVDEAYGLYRSAAMPDDPGPTAFRASFSLSDRTPIRFIGVWDTVGALGVPNVGLPGSNLVNRRWAFHDVKLSSMVQTAAQALAIDEARRPFAPAVWEPQPHAVGQQLEQVWFAGVHCDVGGGYPESGLADISYRWMVDRAAGCGLAFREQPGAGDPLATLHDSRTGMYKMVRPRSRTLGAVDPAHEAAASSAVERSKQDGYHPTGLTQYLGGPHHEMQV